MNAMRFPFASSGLLLLLALVGFLGWAAWFDIDQIVRANGQIIPQERTQIIQAADGGVLQALRVSEGERVSRGQVLAQLESERASSGVQEVRDRMAALSIARLRAQAEANDQSLQLRAFERSHPELVQAQRALYEQNMAGLQKEQATLQGQLVLAREELQMHQRLFEKGDISRVELMRAERAVLEAGQRMQSALDKFRADARKEMARTEDEITIQRSKLQERESVLGHTQIVAPTDGIVKYLRISTLGGVLRAGDELMQISPTEGQHILEAKVNPADIGQLRVGQKAALRLDAFDYSIYGTLPAQLEYLSSDTLNEPGPDGRSTMLYYRARLRIELPPGSRIRPEDIKPGMTASVDLITGKRSVLHYIAKPITRAFSGALGQK